MCNNNNHEDRFKSEREIEGETERERERECVCATENVCEGFELTDHRKESQISPKGENQHLSEKKQEEEEEEEKKKLPHIKELAVRTYSEERERGYLLSHKQQRVVTHRLASDRAQHRADMW